ncbi:MAG: hypothetical protein ACSHX5_10465 [Phycisphaerales bacterium]
MQNQYRFDDERPEYSDPSSSVDHELAADPIPLLKVPYAFFFRPGEYMTRNGIYASQFVLAIVIWITGISLVFSRLENNSVLGRALPEIFDSWSAVLFLALFSGTLRGLIVYGLGTWWYRVRLGFCGYKQSEFSTAGRVYMLSGTAKHLVTILSMAIAMVQFETFKEYLINEDGVIFYITGAISLIAIFWSSFTLYFGSRAVFPLERMWAMVWLLILPLLLRVFGLAALMVGILLLSINPTPSLDNPSTHVNTSFQFEYPSNWIVEYDQEVPGPPTWFKVEPALADAFLQVAIYDLDDSVDQLQVTLDSLIESDMRVVSEGKQRTTIPGLEGRGREYTIKFEGSDYHLTLFVSPIGEYSEIVTMIMSTEDIWDEIKPGFWHTLKTLAVTDPIDMLPDLQRTYTVETEGVQFDIPSNWWVQTQSEPATTNDDGTTNMPYSYAMIQTPGLGYFQLNIYESGLSPRAELGVSLENYTDTGRLESEQPMDQFFGFDGFGISGISPSTDGLTWRTQIHISTLPDDRLLELRSVYPTQYAEQYESGFELIESTFKLLVEPAEVDP